MESKNLENLVDESQVESVVEYLISNVPDLVMLVGNVMYATSSFVQKFDVKKDDEVIANSLMRAYFTLMNQNFNNKQDE